jgi:hypothetical protein
MRFLAPALVLFLFLLPASTQAQSPSAAPAPDAKTAAFTQKLLSAMSHRDMDALAAMFSFPASVHSGSIGAAHRQRRGADEGVRHGVHA